MRLHPLRGTTILLAMVSALTVAFGEPEDRAGGIGFLSEPKLLVGMGYLREPEHVGATELFLAYPSSNFGFPEMSFGVYVELEAPVSLGQIRQYRDFARSGKVAHGVDLFVEVTDDSGHAGSGKVRGRLAGFGFHPNHRFEPFSTGDLNPENFLPFEAPGKAGGDAPAGLPPEAEDAGAESR